MKIKATLFFLMVLFGCCHASDEQPTYFPNDNTVFVDEPVVRYRELRQQNMSVSLEQSAGVDKKASKVQRRKQSAIMDKLANMQIAAQYVQKQQLQEIQESQLEDSVDIARQEKYKKYLPASSRNQTTPTEDTQYDRLKNAWLSQDKPSAKTDNSTVTLQAFDSHDKKEREPSIIKIVCASQAGRSEHRWFADWWCCHSNSAVIVPVQQKK